MRMEQWQRDKIIEMHADGYSALKISGIINIYATSVRKFLIRNGLDSKRKAGNVNKLTDDEINMLKELSAQGNGIEKISKLTGITIHRITKLFKIENIKCTIYSGKITKEIGVQILDLKQNGFNSNEIGKIFNIGRSAICRYIRINADASKLKERKEYLKNVRRIRRNFSKSIHRVLREFSNVSKHKSISQYLPYTIQELKEHIESQFEDWMTWDNWGAYRRLEWDDNDPNTWKWHVDHIKPASEFKYVEMSDPEFQACWSLSNLRPYSAKQNVIDGNNRARHTTKKLLY